MLISDVLSSDVFVEKKVFALRIFKYPTINYVFYFLYCHVYTEKQNESKENLEQSGKYRKQF